MTHDDHLRISEAMPGYLGYCKCCGQEEGISGEFGEDGEKECERCKRINMEDEKKYPKGFDGRQTTKEEWDFYNEALSKHEAYYDSLKPVRGDFETDFEFHKAFSKWLFDKNMDRPNEPGYYRANDD